MYLSQRGIPYPHNPKDVPQVPGIYAVICKPLNLFYVGSTNNLLGRFRQHFTNLARQSMGIGRKQEMIDAYKAHGVDSFEFRILEKLPDVEKHRASTDGKFSAALLEKEGSWIVKLEAEGMKGANSHNIEDPCRVPGGRYARRARINELESKAFCLAQMEYWARRACVASLP